MHRSEQTPVRLDRGACGLDIGEPVPAEGGRGLRDVARRVGHQVAVAGPAGGPGHGSRPVMRSCALVIRWITRATARASALGRDRFTDVETARAAVEAYWGLLAALHRHAWALSGGSRRLAGVSASGNPDPWDRAAVRFIDSLEIAARHPPTWDEPPADTAAHGWRHATRSLLLANDLLATHRDPKDGEPRTPEAAKLEDPRFRATAFVDLADIAVTVLTAQRDLALRTGQSGVSWREVSRRLPDLEPTWQAARDLEREAAFGAHGPGPAADLEVARPQLRTADPIVELGDRIRRLRQNAWQFAREQYVGASCLTEFATAAVVVHTHVHDHVVRDSPAAPGGVSVNSVARMSSDARTAWAEVNQQTRQFRTATPGSAALRDDVATIRDLCQEVWPLRGPRSDPDPEARRRLRALANGSVRAFGEIGKWNWQALHHLATSGQLFIVGFALTGDQVSDCPAMVEAKLTGSLVLAPAEQVRSLAEAYRAAYRVGVGIVAEQRGPHASQSSSQQRSLRDASSRMVSRP